MSNFRVVKNYMSSTVFVPWNCGYNCPFCNSKKSYDIIPQDIEKVIKSVDFVTSSDYIEELCITGGEPLANLEYLKRIIDASKKKVYINTSFTKDISNNQEIIDYINNEKKIVGISVSRPFIPRINESPDEDLEKIHKSLKLNCYIGRSNQRTISELDKIFVNYIDRFSELLKKKPSGQMKIQFREDYRYVRSNTLRGLTTNAAKALYSNPRFYFIFSGGCLACADDSFLDNNTKAFIYYHRGLNNTAIQITKKSPIVVNDVVIYQNGEVTFDWRTEQEVLNPSQKEIKLREELKEFLYNEDDKNFFLMKWKTPSDDLRFKIVK